MNLQQSSRTFLIASAILSICKCATDEEGLQTSSAETEANGTIYTDDIEEMYLVSTYARFADDLLLYTTNDRISAQKLMHMKAQSRICLPMPCTNLTAYAGFISVDKYDYSYLYFLHIKATHKSCTKPLLLWLQGGLGKSTPFGQFLENGPLGIDTSGELYYRHHSLVEQFNVIYLDQPVGSGFSFDYNETYPSTLDEAATHVMRFLRRFLRLFPEYRGRGFYIAGESYGARSAVAVAQRVLTRNSLKFPLRLDGVMLGVGFLFPLLELINSTDYLYYTGLLDDHGTRSFAERFDEIQALVDEENFTTAAELLSETVLDFGEQSLFENLTGFHHHGSIIQPEIPAAVKAYMEYTNDEDFKERMHINRSRELDGTRMEIVANLAVGDFFVDLNETLVSVLNARHVLLYTAQLDAVFPAVNIERCFGNLQWRGKDLFKKAKRHSWHRDDNSSLELLGYEKTADTVMFNTVLFGGHYVSLDRSSAVSELYQRFLRF